MPQPQRNLIDEVVQRVRGDIKAEQGMENFMRDFYAAYPSMRAHQDIVENVLNKNKASWANLTIADAIEALGVACQNAVKNHRRFAEHREEVAAYGGRSDLHNGDAESGTSGGVFDYETAAPETMGDVIRNRRIARRNKSKLTSDAYANESRMRHNR